MPKNQTIRRGALSRALSVSLAGARAGGVFAIDGALKRLRGDEAGDDARLDREARRFAQELGKLKGSYVKIGQLFALLGEHFLPAPLTRALHELEAETEALPWADMEPHFRAALGAQFDELNIEPLALAAASLAQVHRARIKSTGQEVVLKVQYPELAAVLDDDFNAVVRMLRLARWIPVSRDFDSWLATLHEQLHAEMDYPREQAMARTFASALEHHAHLTETQVALKVPQFWQAYCGAQVLTLDYVEGHRAGSVAVAALPQDTRNALGRLMLQLFFIEVFDLGLVQTDPNFGNYLISDSGDELTLLDFGSVMALDDAVRSALCETIVAGLQGDDALLLDALVRLGCLPPDAESHAQETFKTFVTTLLEPLQPIDQLPAEYLNRHGEYCWGRSELINRTGRHVAGSMTSRQFSLPSGDFAMVARKLTGVFTFIAVLDAEFNGDEIAAPFLDGYALKFSKAKQTGERTQ
jgi:predicted unusual protein kinase regulating ubiquinone biosynthesis (AarF/ABC1/UbiB family)